MSDNKKEAGYTNSVERAIDILEYMADCGRPVSVIDICKEYSINRTSVYSIIKVLTNKGYVRKIDDGRYSLTGRMYEYGQRFRNSFPVVHIARGIANELRTDYPCMMNIAMYFHGTHAMLMNSINISSEGILYDRAMGSGQSIPLHATSMGKMLLAYMPPIDAKDIIMQMDFVPYTDNTVNSPEILKKQMDFAVANGYVVEVNEYFDHTFCVSAPIFDSTNCVIAACSISCSEKLMDTHKDTVIRDVKNVARTISSALGATRRM
jgi:DNA-binding IclR family transcriptional regulator